MIRREITFENVGPSWLLISQVEHARISGELAAVWEERFPAEVIEAIRHHDDGWADWEAAPQIDPKLGRPYSFLELPAADAMNIWDGSISAARKIGPLAGWIVAGHFMALLARSEHAQEPLSQQWLKLIGSQRDAWLAEWQGMSPENTLQIAARAQRMLLVADLFSLWLCCDCPLAEGGASILNESDMKDRTAAVLGLYRFAVRESAICTKSDRDNTTLLTWTVGIEPWPLAIAELSLATSASVVPARFYKNTADLAAASSPAQLQWRLVRPASA